MRRRLAMRLGIVALAIGEQVRREEAAETLFDAVGKAEARGHDQQRQQRRQDQPADHDDAHRRAPRSEEHTSELQSLMRSSSAVFCLKKKKTQHTQTYYLSLH